ncbi:AraC-type DNA-binding protein [Filimonas lacunae]|uniref:AraC-type DNA-binding protein n=1 Tax=Filimonas lacunae TaxID=477680 RepID=A0A173MLQ9_9BACT|nr:helix-turn-helix domain-containing protein [Filimonas lacunae]BAV08341.1 transcriptional regulator, AraC family [Filimonas lacunae]SIT33420.1 AraC-type DNA-binding protein [Filimonas lacunae]
MRLIDYLDILVFAGSIQGIITGILLRYAKPRRLSNRLLAVTVWLIALPGIHLCAHHVHFFDGSLATDWMHALVPWVAIMALGPLIYFYIRSVHEPAFVFKREYWRHFLPAGLDLVPKIVEILFLVNLVPVAWMHGREQLIGFLDTYNKYADLPRWLSLAYYIYLSGKYIRQVAPDSSAATWTKHFVVAMQLFVLVWFVYLVPYLIPAFSVVLAKRVGWFPVYIPLAVLIYWIGIAGYRHMLSIAYEVKPKVAEPGYARELLVQTAEKLTACMEADKLYLNPELDVAGLAQAIGVPAKLISATFNQHLNSNFSQFVNEYRVAAFQQKLQQPEAGELTLAGLAASCGFSSQATFQRIFKQLTGVTPAAYRKAGVQQPEEASNNAQIRI